MVAGLSLCQQQTIVVTGSYEPISLNETDRAVSALPVTRNSPLLVKSISDLLKQDSSLDLQERTPNGVQGDLSIRGGTFGQTLVLLNGIRLNDAQSGHHDLDIPVPLDAIQQVEVLHGSGSTQYGSDAVGGVLNIVTRRPEGLEANVRAGVGNFGTNQEAITLGSGTPNYSELLSASRDFSTGFISDRDYRNLQLSSSTMFHDPLGPGSILLALRDTPFGANDFYGNYDSWERTKEWFAAAHQNIGDNTEADIAYRRHTDLFVLFRDNPSYYTNRHADESWEANLRRTDALPFGAKLHYGTEFDVDSIQSNNLGYHSRNREAVYIDYDIRVLKRYSFNIGVRDDVYSGLRNQVSPNLSGAAWLNSHFKIRAAVSRSFRLPTYTDLFYSDPATQGNPNLKPETAWNYEGGLDWLTTGPLQGAITIFQRHDTNVIDYVQENSASLFRATNFQHIVFTGIETSATYKGLSLSYTFLHGNRTLDPGVVSRYVFNYPVQNGVATWQSNLRWGIIARTRIGAQQRLGQTPYAVWDASLASTKGRIQPFLQLTNLTDTYYQTLPNLQQPTRGILGGIKLTITKP